MASAGLKRVEPRAAHACEEIQRLLRTRYGRGLSGTTLRRLDRILDALELGPAPKRRFSTVESTVLFADLRGFSGFAANHAAALVLRLLNEYLVCMSDVVAAHGGVIDKFLGDALMVRFDGTPRSDAALRAVTCAVQMQLAMDGLNTRHRKQGAPPTYMGIGINSGPVMSGVLGSRSHREHTVIGESVNLASRIESVSLRGQVLISDATWRRCRGDVRTGPKSAIQVKGRDRPLIVREVLGIPSLGLTVPLREQRQSPRAPVDVAARYHRIDGKAVNPIGHAAVLRDVGYGGVQMELNAPVPLRSELKLEFQLAPWLKARDVYAKVVRVQAKRGGWRVGLEFTSMDEQLEAKFRRYVQLKMQERPAPMGGSEPAPIT